MEPITSFYSTYISPVMHQATTFTLTLGFLLYYTVVATMAAAKRELCDRRKCHSAQDLRFSREQDGICMRCGRIHFTAP
jgi:hypothetical protein